MTAERDGNEFTRRQVRLMTGWFVVLLVTLAGSTVAVLKMAQNVEPVEVPRREGKEIVVVNVDAGGEPPEEPRTEPPAVPTLAPAPTYVLLDLNVNAVAPPAGKGQVGGSSSSRGSGGGATQRVNVNVGAVSSLQPSPAVGGTGAPESLSGEPVDEPCEPPGAFYNAGGGDPQKPANPCAVAEFLGRVEFETGRRRILASHHERLEEIADRLDIRDGVLLVIGHTDSCGESRLARRRASGVRRELRDLLRRRSAWKGRGHLGGIGVHAQAAGDDPRVPEGSCEARYYGSAGVYLIEGLK